MRELLLGARLTVAGGRAGLVRTLIAAFGVALGVAALLLAASLPTIHGDRQARLEAREAVAVERPAALLVGDVATEFRGEEIVGRLLQPEAPQAPVPPGIERLPRPGELDRMDRRPERRACPGRV